MSTTAEREALAAVLKAKLHALCEMGARTGSRMPNFWQLMADSVLAPPPSEPRANDSTAEREALLDVLAHLVGATSAYRVYAKRHVSQGRAETDAFYSTRLKDFEAAIERGRAALPQPSARPVEPSAPQAEATADDAFEAWASTDDSCRIGYEEHADFARDVAWRAWQAARAAPPAPKGLTRWQEATDAVRNAYAEACGRAGVPPEQFDEVLCYVNDLLAHTSPAKGETEST